MGRPYCVPLGEPDRLCKDKSPDFELIAALAMISVVWTTTLLLTACISEVVVVFPDIAFGR